MFLIYLTNFNLLDNFRKIQQSLESQTVTESGILGNYKAYHEASDGKHMEPVGITL